MISRDAVIALAGCLATLCCSTGCDGGDVISKENVKPRERIQGNYEGYSNDAMELARSVPELPQPRYCGGYSYGVRLIWYGELTEDEVKTITSRLREEKAKNERLRDITLMLQFRKEEIFVDRGVASGWRVTERGKEVEYRRVEIE